MKVAILGGGIAGLSVGYFLKQSKNISFDLFEANDSVGGLCRSVKINDSHFDISGVHVIHSKNKEILDFMLSLLNVSVSKKERKAKILFNDNWVDFPFSSNLKEFIFKDRMLLYFDYLKSRLRHKVYKKEIKNFYDWSVSTFGQLASDIHYLPYAEKIYKSISSEIGFKWIESIIPRPKYTKFKALINPESNFKSTFYYPNHGGIQALITPLECAIKEHIRLNSPVNEMYRVRNGFCVNGEFYDEVISTLPLPELPQLIKDIAPSFLESLAQLKFLSLYTLLIECVGNTKQTASWYYIPGNETPFNRVSYLNNLTESHVQKTTSIVAEMTIRNDDKRKYDNSFFEDSILSLEALNFLSQEEITAWKTNFTKYAYILGDHYYESNIVALREKLTSYGLILHGRFGEFKYLNMDQIIGLSQTRANKLIQKTNTVLT